MLIIQGNYRMKEMKINIKEQVDNIVQQNRSDCKQSMNDTPKSKTNLKFSRQQYSKISHSNSLKTAFIVPQLNFVKTSAQKQQSSFSKQDFQQPYIYSKRTLNRVQTKQTRDPFITHRQSQQQNRNLTNEHFLSHTQSNQFLNSPIQYLLKTHRQSDDQDDIKSQTDKQQILLLQIKHLKRQNTFLKKKIKDLNKQLHGGYLPEQQQREKSAYNKQKTFKKQKKGFSKVNIQSLHLSVNLFFEQIKNLLTSVTQLFKMQFTGQQIRQFQSLHTQQQMTQQLNEEICPLRKHQILKKYFLNRKLDRLSFQEEQKRYELLLSIFTQYYYYKELSQKKVVDTIDSMIMYTNDLNKWLIQKAYSKKAKSEVRSLNSTERQFLGVIQAPKLDTLRVPPNMVNHLNKVRGTTFSPMPKSKECV